MSQLDIIIWFLVLWISPQFCCQVLKTFVINKYNVPVLSISIFEIFKTFPLNIKFSAFLNGNSRVFCRHRISPKSHFWIFDFCANSYFRFGISSLILGIQTLFFAQPVYIHLDYWFQTLNLFFINYYLICLLAFLFLPCHCLAAVLSWNKRKSK